MVVTRTERFVQRCWHVALNCTSFDRGVSLLQGNQWFSSIWQIALLLFCCSCVWRLDQIARIYLFMASLVHAFSSSSSWPASSFFKQSSPKPQRCFLEKSQFLPPNWKICLPFPNFLRIAQVEHQPPCLCCRTWMQARNVTLVMGGSAHSLIWCHIDFLCIFRHVWGSI